MKEKIKIGEQIQKKIDESGKKQKWLAEKMCESESKISRICQNEHINTKDLIPICIHLECNFFELYANYIDRHIPKENSISLSYIYKFVTGNEIHIGKLIKKIKKERKIQAEILANKIGCSEKNIYKLYKRKNMNTAQLIVLSKHLKFNFFELYAEFVDEQIQKKRLLGSNP